MKKYILLLAVLFVSSMVFAQNKNTKDKVKYEQKNDLIEATYFYADGNIHQIGTFNEEGKLHGTWVSFDQEGNKQAEGNYKNGKKTGKWTFWANNTVNEVSYTDSRINSVTDTGNSIN